MNLYLANACFWVCVPLALPVLLAILALIGHAEEHWQSQCTLHSSCDNEPETTRSDIVITTP